jgi:hypothetical protein
VLNLLAFTDPKSFWNAPNGSAELWWKIVLALIIGFGLIGACMAAPPRLRAPIIALVTGISGLFYVLLFLYPSPISRGPSDAPRGTLEAFSFWLADAQPIAAKLANTVNGFLLGLGIYSLLRIHLRKVFKQQKDWGFSLVLIVSLVAMAIFGYWDWYVRQFTKGGGNLAFVPEAKWGVSQYGSDLLFDGMLQQMDGVMFSIISFFILSAAYRAFRARSVEATVLLVTALLVMLNLMSLVGYGWDTVINAGSGHAVVHGVSVPDPNAFLQNLKLREIAGWIRDTLQNSSIRGLDFGVGIGLMAMGLRLWLSLEKIGGEA